MKWQTADDGELEFGRRILLLKSLVTTLPVVDKPTVDEALRYSFVALTSELEASR